ncbi:hypothetical protein FQA39_LY08414 [Lamprigera yunnana]|nr:hypothetical protein FQA39_LY08414 [Lamprigera yunnana]
MVERRNAVDDDNTQKPRGDLGLTNWTQIFFVVLSIVYVLENYITYGIIKNPVELTILAIEFIQEYWWFVKSAIISYVVSGLLCLIVENGLAANIIPEKYGMAIQIFNSMLPLNIGAILSYLHNVNPVAGVALSTFFFACSIKLLSYCLENQKYRKVFKDSSLAPSAKTKYPQNLTLRDLLVHLCDGGHMYDGRIVRREPRTIKKFARLVFSAIALNYIIAFIVYQYVLPELDLAFHFVTTKHYIGVFKCGYDKEANHGLLIIKSGSVTANWIVSPVVAGPESSKGIRNWAFVMLTYYTILFILDNYKRFGIIKQMHEILILVLDGVVNSWWVFGLVIIYILQQTLQMFIIEKLLQLNILSNRAGLTLHGINAFYSLTCLIVAVRVYSLSVAIMRIFAQMVVFKVPKVWSYAYFNYNLRQQLTKNKKEGTSSIFYPANVTLRNALEYMFLTPDIQYQLSYPKRTSPNWKRFLLKLLYLFIVQCLICFVTIQYFIPEMGVLRSANLKWFEIVSSVIKLIICVHVGWLLLYVVTYKIYHPGNADVTGLTNLTFNSDWWNAEHLPEFWRRWNHIMHLCIKDNIVKPLLRNNWSKAQSELVAFLIAGVLHEALYTLPIGCCNGSGILVTLLEIPVGRLSNYISRTYGKEYGNVLLWMYLHFTHAFGVIYLDYKNNIFHLSIISQTL